MISMREDGKASTISNVVLFDTNDTYEENKAKALRLGIQTLTMDEVIEAGKKSNAALDPDAVQGDDIIMLNYTSGTTGDPKGVKVPAWGSAMDAIMGGVECSATENDVVISYLPSPHAFDQITFAMIMINGGRVGYYHGDTLALTDDCAVL